MSGSKCILWTGRLDANGYPRVYLDGDDRGAHRDAIRRREGLTWEQMRGVVVRHICHNAICVNPLHLKIGTHADNVADRVAAGRSARGETNGRAKLTRRQVIEIRRIRLTGATYKAIAARFGVCEWTVRKIVSGDRWAHVQDPDPMQGGLFDD